MQLSPQPPQTRFRGLLNWADSRGKHRRFPLDLLHKLVRILLITFREFRENNLTLRSAALTFTILLSLVPILAMSTAVVKGLGGSNQLKEAAYTYIDTLNQSTGSASLNHWGHDQAAGAAAPGETGASTLTTNLRQAVDKLFAYVDKTNFATLGSLGVAGIFLSVILVFGNIEQALNAIWQVKNSRSIARKVADYLALIVLMPISINVAFAASAFLANPALAAKFQMLIPFLWLQTLILKLVPVFFFTLTFYLIYIFFPNTRVRTRPALLGAFLAAILWFTVQNLYLDLQIGVSNYNAIYGSFAILPLFLVWMYLGWLTVLGGAQIAYACQHLHAYRLLPTASEPSLRLGAAFDIMDSVGKAFAENTPLTIDTLIDHQPSYDGGLVREVAEQLIAAEVLYISTKKARLLPSAPADKIDHRLIISILLGTGTADTPGGKASRQAIEAAAAYSSAAFGSVQPESTSGNLQDGPSST